MDASPSARGKGREIVGRALEVASNLVPIGEGEVVSSLQATVTPADRARRLHAHSRRLSPRLIVGCYVLAAVGLTWRLWANPAVTAPTQAGGRGVSTDVYFMAWCLRYSAAAIAHGGLPALTTTALNAPHGVNMMWNTSMLLPGVLLAPVTLVAGPVTSLIVLLTVGFAGSAASMFFVLRWWGATIGAAAIGGALYGFSPALLVAAQDHSDLQFAVLPPLIIHTALRLAAGHGRTLRTGAWLGLLVAAQVFIDEELLFDTAVAGLVILAVLVASRPSMVLPRAPGAAAGLGVALVVVALLCGHALLVQLFGPLTEHGSAWRMGGFGNQPPDFVTAPSTQLFHGAIASFISRTRQSAAEYLGYLGWPMLLMPTAAAVVFWRDAKIRAAAVGFALLELLSVGGHAVTAGGWHVGPGLLPWHWLTRLTLLAPLVPNRFSILADGAAAVVLAFAADRTIAAMRGSRDWRSLAIAAAAATALMLVILPVVPRPLAASTVSALPPGWRPAIARLHLPAGASLLVLPVNGPLTMEWQAVTGDQFSIAGGYCLAAAGNGQAAVCDTHATLSKEQLTTAFLLSHLAAGWPTSGPSNDTMADAIQGWRPAAVISPAGGSRLGRYLIQFFGTPTVRDGGVLGCRLHGNWDGRLPAGHRRNHLPQAHVRQMSVQSGPDLSARPNHHIGCSRAGQSP